MFAFILGLHFNPTPPIEKEANHVSSKTNVLQSSSPSSNDTDRPTLNASWRLEQAKKLECNECTLPFSSQINHRSIDPTAQLLLFYSI
jgi:hypothetical protein